MGIGGVRGLRAVAGGLYPASWDVETGMPRRNAKAGLQSLFVQPLIARFNRCNSELPGILIIVLTGEIDTTAENC